MPALGIFPNSISIPDLSLSAIPVVSSSTILLISLGIFLESNNPTKLFASL